MASIAQFYSENPLHVWQHVLASKMHYHLGSQSNDNIFDQAIRNLYPHISQNSKILDCGCGWGGPGNLLQTELNAIVTGITNSKQQHEYITSFPTYLTDIHKFIPEQQYDIALFIESFCHFHQPQSILSNLRSHTNKIIIKDYIWDSDWYNEAWHMYFRTPDSYSKLIHKSGYTITSIQQDTSTEVYNSSLFWYNNILSLPPSEVYGQIQSLLELTTAVLQSGVDGQFVEMITIVAE
jgi:hypothetical protein